MSDDLIRKARVLAAERNLSVSGLLREELRRLVEERDRYRDARELALRRLAQGEHLGGDPLPRREELYERGPLS